MPAARLVSPLTRRFRRRACLLQSALATTRHLRFCTKHAHAGCGHVRAAENYGFHINM
jgi:hypothetical protein